VVVVVEKRKEKGESRVVGPLNGLVGARGLTTRLHLARIGQRDGGVQGQIKSRPEQTTTAVIRNDQRTRRGRGPPSAVQ
jgi:hypothetical protein